MSNLEKLINDAKEEFISKFTVWNDKYRYATLEGKEEYPTPDMIANWWEKKLTQAYNQGKDEIIQIIKDSKWEIGDQYNSQYLENAKIAELQINNILSLIKKD